MPPVWLTLSLGISSGSEYPSLLDEFQKHESSQDTIPPPPSGKKNTHHAVAGDFVHLGGEGTAHQGFYEYDGGVRTPLPIELAGAGAPLLKLFVNSIPLPPPPTPLPGDW